MDHRNRYHLRVWQPPENTILDARFRNHHSDDLDFYIDFQVFYILQDRSHRVLDLVEELHQRYCLERSKFISEEELQLTIGYELRLIGVPYEDIERENILGRISAFARQTVRDERNMSSRVIPINIFIEIVNVQQYEEDELSRVTMESIRDIRFQPVPATESSIGALEKVCLEGDAYCGSMELCVVCLEGFSVAKEVTRMPCMHVYHGDCIIQWLKTSHLCPLCRFPMPCSSNP